MRLSVNTDIQLITVMKIKENCLTPRRKMPQSLVLHMHISISMLLPLFSIHLDQGRIEYKQQASPGNLRTCAEQHGRDRE